MKTKLSARVRTLAPSATLAVDGTVKKLQSQGKKILNLSLGEPDFDTPKNIQDAAILAMQKGHTHYTTTAGITKLREEVAKKFLKENHISYDPSEIVVGVGSKQLLYNALMVLCDEGDEVIVPVPTWSTYIEQIKLCKATPCEAKMKPPFKLTVKDLEKKISKKTKAIILNSPANPTGAVIEEEELKNITKLAMAKNVWIIADEIYEKILYMDTRRHAELDSASKEIPKQDGYRTVTRQVRDDKVKKIQHISIASFGREIKARTITINGFSKSYAMTGWRIGYAGGPKEVISAMINLQSQTTSNTSSLAQYAGVEALTGSQRSIKKMADAFAKRRRFLLKAFVADLDRLSVVPPEGAFYLFINVTKCLGKEYKTSSDWCTGLLEKEHVALVPGEAFLYPGWVRLSFAAADDVLEEAVKRIKRFVKISN
ncbi:MAG: pyridoxal phosphate-dependent aminotransferase [Candidatus Levybacteria bacterium]|nr:pyridoxal phosphate-dependent aminotransferase [Candidatus Levybacteria bacterium]